MSRFWIGAIVLVSLGVVAGIIGERTRWFGLAKYRLTARNARR